MDLLALLLHNVFCEGKKRLVRRWVNHAHCDGFGHVGREQGSEVVWRVVTDGGRVGHQRHGLRLRVKHRLMAEGEHRLQEALLVPTVKGMRQTHSGVIAVFIRSCEKISAGCLPRFTAL